MTEEEMIANEMSDTYKEVISLIEQEVSKARQEKCNSCGLRQQKRVNLEKENVELKKQIEKWNLVLIVHMIILTMMNVMVAEMEIN